MKTRLRKQAPGHQPSAYVYQQENWYVARVEESFKAAGIQELADLGAADIEPTPRGIRFSADRATLYKINYTSRLLSRCLAPLAVFPCRHADDLYSAGKALPWKDFFIKGRTFAITADVVNSDITDARYTTLRLKDAIADYFTENTGRQRPDVDTRNPDVRVDVTVLDNRAVISLDTSGEALHKRGYRELSVSAPMQETVAAAILHFSRWDKKTPLYDPMCGSGTLLCEALMAACNIPAGILRNAFGFQILPDFDPALWQQVRKAADAGITEIPEGLIAGSDVNPAAVTAAKTNLMGLHYGGRVSIAQQAFLDIPELENRLIITNPPYGIRMGRDRDLRFFYKCLGDFLKQKCRGSTAWIYFGDRDYIKNLGLKTAWKLPLRAGGLDGRLVRYELY
ncbi:MAG: THUMP domain-containing protein [Thermodesulfobacteriota bacterium]|nr:THUMP domain-containing protein [Thermodesulfobacteriota bacterium]